ncbi:carbohydrate kinase [uncultured Ilyobacter sp.]|uniref:carbohydrate kinase family protein n=1 Tax=uncultured Ilyobacter sp. TaxID=544433 RepID=UPI0029C8C587|nr:carbohydrate kinase [uncultured Ilyobacter sp.]
MNPKIVCIGELLIDFICKDIDSDLVDGESFEKKAGGAPANVCAAAAKLGQKVGFIGKVGNDSFGKFLERTLTETGVDTKMLYFDREKPTTLAFVSLRKDGERDFIFNRGADENLSFGELDLKNLKDTKIFHFGSATALLGGNLKKTYYELMKYAKSKGAFVSFDPNWRGALFGERKEEFVAESIKCLAYADFTKVSDEEARIISGKENLEEAVDEIHKYGTPVVVVTLGKDGTLLSIDGKKIVVKSIEVKSIDSTGAGDAFIGAVLYKLSMEENPKEVICTLEKSKEIVGFANKVGAITCTKLGAIAALPTLDDLEKIKTENNIVN